MRSILIIGALGGATLAVAIAVGQSAVGRPVAQADPVPLLPATPPAAEIIVVPSPGTASLLVLGGLVSFARRPHARRGDAGQRG